jgi:hypothetical protein
MTKEDSNPYHNLTDDIISFENGLLDEEEVIDLFQRLITTGYIYNLQGMYHRIANDLIESGLIQ